MAYKETVLRLELSQLEEILRKAQVIAEANEYLNDAHIEPNELVLRILQSTGGEE